LYPHGRRVLHSEIANFAGCTLVIAQKGSITLSTVPMAEGLCWYGKGLWHLGLLGGTGYAVLLGLFMTLGRFSEAEGTPLYLRGFITL
jgi:hypothetical protein